MKSIKVNSRIKIIEDCRENGHTKGMLGNYLGNFYYLDQDFKNPKILLDNGDIIWGIECWWEEYDANKSMEESEKEIQTYKEFFYTINKK